MLTQTLSDAIAPLIIVNRILGTSIVDQGKWRTFQIIVYFITFVSLLVYFLQSDDVRHILHSIEIKSTLFLVTFRSVARTLTIVYWFFYKFYKHKQFQVQLSKLSVIEMELIKFDHSGYILKSTKSIRRVLTYLSVGVLLVYNFIFESILLSFHYVIVHNWVRWLTVQVIEIYPRLVIVNVNLMFYAIQLILESRFNVINNWMKRKIHASTKVGKFPLEINFSEKLARLVTLHRDLVDVAKTFNSLFDLYLLTRIAVSFVLVVGDLYRIMHMVLLDAQVNIIAITTLLHHVVSHTLDLFLFAHQSQKLCNEANSTKQLLARIKVDVDQEDVRDALILESFKLTQNHLEISACQLFSINNSLLFAIFGAASSYIFIMIQLDLGSKNLSQNVTTSSLQ